MAEVMEYGVISNVPPSLKATGGGGLLQKGVYVLLINT